MSFHQPRALPILCQLYTFSQHPKRLDRPRHQVVRTRTDPWKKTCPGVNRDGDRPPQRTCWHRPPFGIEDPPNPDRPAQPIGARSSPCLALKIHPPGATLRGPTPKNTGSTERPRLLPERHEGAWHENATRHAGHGDDRSSPRRTKKTSDVETCPFTLQEILHGWKNPKTHLNQFNVQGASSFVTLPFFICVHVNVKQSS